MTTIVPDTLNPTSTTLRSLAKQHRQAARTLEDTARKLEGELERVEEVSNEEAIEKPSEKPTRIEEARAFLLDKEPQRAKDIANALGIQPSNMTQILRLAVTKHRKTSGIRRVSKGLYTAK